MMVNLVMFVLAIRLIVTHNRKKAIEGHERPVMKFTIKTIISIIWLIVIFGLTWLFGALTITGASEVFQYLFIITNGFQGFYLFLFICIITEDGRELWIDIITFGKLRRKRTTFISTSKIHNACKVQKDGTATNTSGTGVLSITSPSTTGPNYFEQLSSPSSSSSNTSLPNDLEINEKPNEIEMSLVQKNEAAIAKDDKCLLCEVEEVFKRHSQSSNESELEQGVSFRDGIASSRISDTGSLDGFNVPICVADVESALTTESERTDEKVVIMANPAAIKTGWHVLENSPSFEKYTENTAFKLPSESVPVAVEQEMPHGRELEGAIRTNQDIENGGWQVLNTSVDEGSNATTSV